MSMALANVNPQNELADIISEPSANLHSFKVIICFSVIFVQTAVKKRGV